MQTCYSSLRMGNEACRCKNLPQDIEKVRERIVIYYRVLKLTAPVHLLSFKVILCVKYTFTIY